MHGGERHYYFVMIWPYMCAIINKEKQERTNMSEDKIPFKMDDCMNIVNSDNQGQIDISRFLEEIEEAYI